MGYEFCATAAQPGSEEKINILVERYARNAPLWHPDDVTARPSLSEHGRGPVSSSPRDQPEPPAVVVGGFDDDDDNSFGGGANNGNHY